MPRQQSLSPQQQARATQAEIVVNLAATPGELIEDKPEARVNTSGYLPVDEATPRVAGGALILPILREKSGAPEEMRCIRDARTKQLEWSR